MSRRRALLGSAGVAAAAWSGLSGARAAQIADTVDVDVHIELRAMPDEVSILTGAPTRVWRYRGALLRGPAGALDASYRHAPGPIIRVRRGQRVRIDLVNGLPESTIVHWHGLHVPETMDGHPRFAIDPGERYVYEFTVDNRAGSYWFHPHPHGRTGKQVYLGLAGLFIVSDDEEAALGLPDGEHDLPLVLQDRSFDAHHQLVYLGSDAGDDSPRGGMMGGGMMGRGGGMGSMMAGMMGVLGDRVLVNGRPADPVNVERRAYRLRLVNASNTRRYKVAWSDASPLTVIGTDGGLLPAPVQRAHVLLAPAERIDLWVDFGHWSSGAEPALRSLAFDPGMGMGMGGMTGGRGALADGAPFVLQRFRVASGARVRASLPQRLSAVPRADPSIALNAGRPKVFDLTMGMMRWGINGESFEMIEASALETVRLGTHEVWEFRNDGRGGGMMRMAMAHSMHVHGLQFRVVARSSQGRAVSAADAAAAGRVDEGWKDTVLVMPGERVRILLGFEDHPGLFLYHCHMLEHEDSGMMRNYRVEA